ncbi:MAG: Rieske 2Fe-2S domain-containing protein [Xanthomonadaceae bacterium]|nr:Rieske 2Fe-2S domain-containing protein [Xanthomonadaceae bacterium]
MDTFSPVPPGAGQALCRVESVAEGSACAVDVVLADGAESLILLRRAGQLRAYLNICPHAGRRLDYAPGQFLLTNDNLICAVHGATFNQLDGLCIGGPCRGERLREVALQIRDGMVCLAADA